jgi:hypothetical protein
LRSTQVRGGFAATWRRLVRIGPWSINIVRYRSGWDPKSDVADAQTALPVGWLCEVEYAAQRQLKSGATHTGRPAYLWEHIRPECWPDETIVQRQIFAGPWAPRSDAVDDLADEARSAVRAEAVALDRQGGTVSAHWVAAHLHHIADYGCRQPQTGQTCVHQPGTVEQAKRPEVAEEVQA